eukprot:GHVQ01014476.1.p1 GENE.GHVQ01014476.1~~GHVQ01014476.1.p1  ORF type:complete len:224 (+),score=8.49 GHVQ01014476.1:228-899(+)
MNKIPKKSHKKGQPPVGVRESEAATVVGLSLLDNCLTYIVFFKMGSPDANMYNLFEATLILMQTPLAALILSFAVSGTLLIVLGIVSFFWKPRLFRCIQRYTNTYICCAMCCHLRPPRKYSLPLYALSLSLLIIFSTVSVFLSTFPQASLSEGGFRGGLALISLFCCVLTSISWSLFCSIRLHSRLRSPLIVVMLFYYVCFINCSSICKTIFNVYSKLYYILN